MKRSDRLKPAILLGCLLLALLLGSCASEEPAPSPTPAPTEEITPEVFALTIDTPQPAAEMTPAPEAAPANATIDPAIQAIRDLSARVGIPAGFSQLGVTKADIEGWLDKALADPCAPCNPRAASRDEVRELYLEAL